MITIVVARYLHLRRMMSSQNQAANQILWATRLFFETATPAPEAWFRPGQPHSNLTESVQVFQILLGMKWLNLSRDDLEMPWWFQVATRWIHCLASVPGCRQCIKHAVNQYEQLGNGMRISKNKRYDGGMCVYYIYIHIVIMIKEN